MLIRSFKYLIGVFVAGAVLVATLHATSATAGLSSRCGTDEASGPLRRQLAALQRIRDERGCGQAGRGGLFNACRDLDDRLQQLRASLPGGALPSSACAAPATARQAPNRQEPNREAQRDTKAAHGTARRVVDKGTRRQARPSPAPASGQAIRSMCVRLSDGYFFPSPNSGYSTARELATIRTQCQIMCDTPDMAVYRPGPDDSPAEDMVALADGSRYGDLATAGRFYASPSFQRCDMARYSRVVSRMQRQADRAAGIIRVVPTWRPRGLSLDDKARGWQLRTAELASPRPVRLVGTPFYPDMLRFPSSQRSSSVPPESGPDMIILSASAR